MRKGLKRLLCVALCAVLLSACIGSASAAAKKKAEEPYFTKMFSSWYYVTSTIPAGMESTNRYSVSELSDKDYRIQEPAESCEVSFVSGDEALRDAVTVEEDHYSDGSKYFCIEIHNDKLTAVGQAVFKIVVESASLKWEGKETLVVIDYNEHPLVEAKKTELEYDARIGDAFADRDLMAEAAEIHANEIAKEIKFKTSISDLNQNFLRLDYNYDDYQGLDNSWERAEDAVDIKYDYPKSGSDVSIKSAVIQKYGVHHMFVTFDMGNIEYRVPLTLKAEGFAIETYDKPVPGGTVQYEAYGSAEKPEVTWSLEGAGATIDPKTGLITIGADTPMGSVFMVKATKKDGSEVSEELVLNNGILADVDFPTTREDGGFLVPVPGGDWYNSDFSYWYMGLILDAMDGRTNSFMDGRVYLTGTKENSEILLEDPELARQYMEANLLYSEGENIRNLKTDWVDIDGHPAFLQAFAYYENGAFYGNYGFMYYVRNTRLLQIRVYIRPRGEETPENIAPVTIEDLKKYASFLKYDPEQAPFVASDAELTVSAKDGAVAVSAGKTLQLTAAFANPDRVNKKNKNDTVNWTVTKAGTEEAPEGVSISNKGQLKVDKSLTMPTEVQVKAESAKYGSTATITLSAIPVAGQMAVEPAELFFYLGTEEPQTVKAILTPDTVPLTGITWKAAKEGIVEITAVEDGVVSIKPLAAGKTTIDVKEPGGKSVKLNASVVTPVESVELTAKGNAKAGGSVNLSAALQPKEAGNKNVEWSLDVGEDVATINAKGQMKISKTAASGTRITVTCKALGAPEPIVATTVIEIP